MSDQAAKGNSHDSPFSREKTLILPILGDERIAALQGYVVNGTLDFNALVMQVDTDLVADGVEPFQRPLHALTKISDLLGVTATI